MSKNNSTTYKTLVSVDIAPDPDKAVCNNCKHISIWGVTTGYCAVKHENKNLGQTCKKFETK